MGQAAALGQSPVCSYDPEFEQKIAAACDSSLSFKEMVLDDNDVEYSRVSLGDATCEIQGLGSIDLSVNDALLVCNFEDRMYSLALQPHTMVRKDLGALAIFSVKDNSSLAVTLLGRVKSDDDETSDYHVYETEAEMTVTAG